VIAHFERGDTLAHFHHNACALMAKDRRKYTLGVIARAGELIRVAQACGLYLYQNLAAFGAFQIDLHDLKRFSGFNGDGGTGLHHGESS